MSFLRNKVLRRSVMPQWPYSNLGLLGLFLIRSTCQDCGCRSCASCASAVQVRCLHNRVSLLFPKSFWADNWAKQRTPVVLIDDSDRRINLDGLQLELGSCDVTLFCATLSFKQLSRYSLLSSSPNSWYGRQAATSAELWTFILIFTTRELYKMPLLGGSDFQAIIVR